MSDTTKGLRINFYAIGLPFNGDTIKKKSLGGSESAAYYLGRELAKLGHNVTMWTAEKEEGTFDDVKYVWNGEHTEAAPLGERFEHYARNTPHDVLIVQRGAGAFVRPFASKVNIWQLHDLALHRYTAPMMGGMWQVDAVTVVSEFHKKQVQEVWNVNPDIIHVVRNGVDQNLYELPVSAPAEAELHAFLKEVNPDNKALLLYQSRPERGLEHLVRPGGIMDRVRDLPVKLLVGGYDNTIPHMAEFYTQLKLWAQVLPNVTYINPLTKQELALLQKKCDLLIYPTEFEEVSCITAMEAQCAGLPMLTSDCAALPETCEKSGTVLIPLKDGKADEDAFIAELTAQFGGEGEDDLHLLKRKQLTVAPITSWRWQGETLSRLCYKLIDQKLTVPRALRHALEHSDIDFARWILQDKFSDDPISWSVKDEIDRLYTFTESDHKYETHYRKHQGVYYDANEEQVIGEDVTSSTRFRGVLGMLAEARNKIGPKKLRVLDYGCAHGHYTIPLAKTFKDDDFIGLDISERAIKAAGKWAQRDEVKNISFFHGARVFGQYDIIIAAEVLEHVRDAAEFLAHLREHTTREGCIIFTTPNGRWEWQGTVPFRTGREHLRHYEREDIEDLCGDNVHEIAHAPAGADYSGRPMGSWVWSVWPKEPFDRIDYKRKFERYAPRETVSACLIVKDGEKTIRKCVESFLDFVDEVNIYVDPKTTDRTFSIAEQLAGDFPNRPFNVRMAQRSALVDGFDEARNESIEDASGDWILWCDADEEVRRASMLHMFLRPSMHNGYGFPQVHYSADPDQVLTTDFPCRLFRNRTGVKFYGVVHEHPETELGKAVTWSIVRHELKFLHAGYIDEDTRRSRYQRNLPLVHRDRKKFPTRELNRFLMIRDIAQGLMFEHQQTGGQLLPHHKDQATEGIQLMEEMVEHSKQVRMISDAMMYYSHCVATQGGGFDAEFTCNVKNDTAPDLSASMKVSGRFHSREFFNKVVSKFSQESTKLYEDKYL
jgi:2-polyprenyl-3-methyl-5-hydroxy-6-metoxy-1,4-benzoquinol methylase/glycosyltransferase involved in cell wall biosynthesis